MLDIKSYENHKKYTEGKYVPKDKLIKMIIEKEKRTKFYYALSFGAGTQSTHLFYKHLKGEIYYDFIIWADTGAEPKFIHDQVQFWINKQKEYNNTTPFIIVKHNKMDGGLEEMLYRYFDIDLGYERFQLPIHCCKCIDGELIKIGMMKRQCTGDFKILPVQRKFRELIMKKHNIESNRNFPKDIALIMDIGFSSDEISRVSDYRSLNYKYIYLSYPLIDMDISTQESIDFLKDNNYPDKRSRCYFCPFNTCFNNSKGMDWQEIIDNEPLSFLKACYLDEKLREVQATGKKRMTSIPFFSSLRIPLKEIYDEEYNKLLPIYANDLLKWIDDWEQDIKEKYY